MRPMDEDFTPKRKEAGSFKRGGAGVGSQNFYVNFKDS